MFAVIAKWKRGFILAWSGSIATIPAGWALCDGNNGTQDLRDKFIVGASQDDGGVAKSEVDGTLKQTGGSLGHTHPYFGYGHYHVLQAGTDIPDFAGTGAYSTDTSDEPDDGVTDNTDNVPPFYALAFIMKL